MDENPKNKGKKGKIWTCQDCPAKIQGSSVFMHPSSGGRRCQKCYIAAYDELEQKAKKYHSDD